MDLDPVQIRILGCLVEKQRTTPDAYPLSLNALRLACNQATNRDPVLALEEGEIRAAMGELGRRRLIRSAHGHGGRALKYRHLLDDALGLPGEQLAVLAVLMLRAPQTPGELKQRSERLHRFADLAALHEALDGLLERELVSQLPRRPGQKEERYEQRLGADGEEAEDVGEGAATATDAGAGRAADPLPGPAEQSRIERLERELAELRERVAALEATGDRR
jgi:uncharacterized protein